MSFDLIIKNGTVILENEARVVDIAVKGGKIAAIGQDLGVRPRSALAESFESCCSQVHVVGDARKGGRIATAVREGFEAAYIFEA